MKSKLTISFIVACLLICSNKIMAQEDLRFAIFYKYAHKFERVNSEYFLGFGSSLSKNISDKFIFSTGFEYSYYSRDYEMRITPPTYRTVYIFKESIYSLDIGLSYPIINNRFAVKIGGSLVPSYFHNNSDVSRYIYSTNQLDLYFKNHEDIFSLGIRAKANFEYSINDDISFFIQTGYTYYLTGDYKDKFLNCSAGVILKL